MSLLGGLTSTLGGIWTNKENQKFAEEMAGSQYQRAVADMKQAGLNPNAVFGSGGGSPASSPGGQMDNPVSGDMGNFLSSAKQGVDIKAGLSEADKIEAEAKIAKSNADVITRENSAYKTALETEPGKAAATFKKYQGSGIPGWLGGAGAVAGYGAGSGWGGIVTGKDAATLDSPGKAFGAWLQQNAAGGRGPFEERFKERTK